MKPKVSVIVPVYNGEKTIKRCINALTAQTLAEIEIIIINDGSTDATSDVIASISDSRIRCITTENRGQGLARNTGLQSANGEYIGFCDADDTVEADMFEKLYNTATKYSADMVQCAIRDIENGTENIRSCENAPDISIDNLNTYLAEYFYSLKHTNEVCNKLYSANFIKENNLKFSDTNIVFSEDLDFNIRILAYLKKVCFIPDALYNYYISPSGHFKSNPYGRISKIFRLYDDAVASLPYKKLKQCIKSMAVITLLSYSVGYTDDSAVRKMICSQKMKNFMLASVLYRKDLRHTLLMLILIAAPYGVKSRIINTHYRF